MRVQALIKPSNEGRHSPTPNSHTEIYIKCVEKRVSMLAMGLRVDIKS